MTFFLRLSFRCLASLATVVVLCPAPCRPAIRITAGAGTLRLRSGLRPSPPRARRARCAPAPGPGSSERMTSWPTARTLMRWTSACTTGSATSASSSAIRTSRTASLMLDSVSRPRPQALDGAGQALGQGFEHGGRRGDEGRAVYRPRRAHRLCDTSADADAPAIAIVLYLAATALLWRGAAAGSARPRLDPGVTAGGAVPCRNPRRGVAPLLGPGHAFLRRAVADRHRHGSVDGGVRGIRGGCRRWASWCSASRRSACWATPHTGMPTPPAPWTGACNCTRGWPCLHTRRSRWPRCWPCS